MQSTAIHTRLFAVVYGTAQRSNIFTGILFYTVSTDTSQPFSVLNESNAANPSTPVGTEFPDKLIVSDTYMPYIGTYTSKIDIIKIIQSSS